jgi:hypothetical protein
MTWRERLWRLAWWAGVASVRPWPRDRPRPAGPPRFAPQRAEWLRDPLEAADEREERLDWRIRELERELALDRERYGRERRP